MTEGLAMLEQHDDIAHLVLNAPPGNAMSAALFAELAAVCATLPTLDIAGLVVRGTGRHFSSGAALDELYSLVRSETPGDTQFLSDNVDTFRALEALPYPVVAAVSGCCLGAGLELALSCHYRIATPRATFGLPESTFALMPGCGGTIRLAEVVGHGRAIEMILSGQALLADDALAAGLVDAVVDRKALVASAEDLVRKNRNQGWVVRLDRAGAREPA